MKEIFPKKSTGAFTLPCDLFFQVIIFRLLSDFFFSYASSV